MMRAVLRAGLLALVGSVFCSVALAEHPHIVNTPRNRLAGEVLKNLLSSPLGRTMPHLEYTVTLLQDGDANAFSNYYGHVYITRGLFPALATDPGVWAAVIGHELGHVLLRHRGYIPGFDAQLRGDYLQARAEAHDSSPSVLTQVRLGHGISELKLSRETELQADFIGMMLMAEAGYQPGFSVLLDQRLRNGLGGTPGIVAAFSHHPRLETREQHADKFYAAAMDIFRMRWPAPQDSPGGNLPPYGKLGRWTLTRKDGELVFDVPYQIHNAKGMTVRVSAIFLNKNLRIRSTVAKYRAGDGSWELNAYALGAQDKSGQAVLGAPAASLAPHPTHLIAVIFLMAGDRVVDLSTVHTTLAQAPR